MALTFYWGSGSPYAWRVLLALEYKRLQYTSHVLQFSKQGKMLNAFNMTKAPDRMAVNGLDEIASLFRDEFVEFHRLIDESSEIQAFQVQPHRAGFSL